MALPGHGKAVLTTYLLTHRHRLNRGIAMGTVAALLQGFTALLFVYGLTGLAGWLPRPRPFSEDAPRFPRGLPVAAVASAFYPMPP